MISKLSLIAFVSTLYFTVLYFEPDIILAACYPLLIAVVAAYSFRPNKP